MAEGRTGRVSGAVRRRLVRSPGLARVVDRAAYAVIGVGLERWARLVSVGVVPLFLAEAGVRIAVIYGALATYVLLTGLARRDRFVRSGDLLVAAAVIAATEGQVGPFLLFLLVAVAGPASSAGVLAGVGAGGMLAAILLAVLGLDGQLGRLGWAGVAPVAVLLPATGIGVAAAVQLLDARNVRDRRVLQEANRLLSSLRGIADDLPGGLDATTIAAALLAEIRALPGVRAAAVFVEDQGVFQPMASVALQPGHLPTLRLDVARRLGDDRVRSREELPDVLGSACADHPCWLTVRVGTDRRLAALLLVGADDPAAARDLRALVPQVADDGALALDNARLFDGTLVRAADAARRRLASDLHDGVAQSLTHLRMELELRADGDADLRRLSRVAETALADLRATIAGLRTPLDGDLAARLERHVAEISPTTGPVITLETAGTADISPERAEDLLRIAQEALSNALRHADASTITVALERDRDVIELVIEDDGRGCDGASPDAADGGVGLRSIRERADRLDADLTIRERLGGGTVVSVRCAPRPRNPDPAEVT